MKEKSHSKKLWKWFTELELVFAAMHQKWPQLLQRNMQTDDSERSAADGGNLVARDLKHCSAPLKGEKLHWYKKEEK